MKLAVTNEERAGVAMWLVPGAWGGTEEQLSALAEVFEVFELEEYRAPITTVDERGNFALPLHLISRRQEREVTLSRDTVVGLLEMYPRQGTPGAVGVGKARLLRKLRALVPREQADK